MKPHEDHEDHEDLLIVPTDFVRIERDYRDFDNMDDLENFTLELYEFIVKTFPEAYIAKAELYPESIGCDIRYLKGDSRELFDILQAIQEEFEVESLQVETDLFETKQEEILEAAVNHSIDLGYDPEIDYVHVRQIIQHVHFNKGMTYEGLCAQTETFDSTIIHTGLSPRSEFPQRFVPPFHYSEIRTNYIEA